jgi:hypothetical protein
MSVVNVLDVKVKGVKTGRKPNPLSQRQQRLAEMRAKVESGVVIKRGRPTVEGSARQVRINELAVKRANPTFKLGRSIDLTSKRQIRLAELEIKRANGECRRGRPKKQVDEVSLIDMLKDKV